MKREGEENGIGRGKQKSSKRKRIPSESKMIEKESYYRESEIREMVIKSKVATVELFAETLKEDERFEIILYLMKEMKSIREKAEEHIRSLEIEIDSLKDENEELKRKIEELKTLSKEEKRILAS